MIFNVLNRKHYDILTALRGPDSDSVAACHTKAITTSVLRFLVGMREPCQCVVNTPFEARQWWTGSSDGMRNLVREFLRTNGHFEHHFLMGMTSLIATLEQGDNPAEAGPVIEYFNWYWYVVYFQTTPDQSAKSDV
jgi:hypothetical protein